MRRWADTRILAGIASVVFVGAAIAGLWLLVQESRDLRMTVRSSGFIVAKANDEFLMAMHAISLSRLDPDPALFEEARLRIDIFWNRLGILQEGGETEDVRALAGFDAIASRMRTTLEALDTCLVSHARLASPACDAPVAALEPVRRDVNYMMQRLLHQIMDVEDPRRLILYNQWIIISFSGALLFGVMLILLLSRELMHRRVAVDEAQEAQALAESANRTKDTFLASMSHELRTPLNAIIGFAEFIQMKPFGNIDARYGDYVGDIRKAGHRLLDVVNDVLDVSRVAAGRIEHDLVAVSIESLAHDCIRLVEPMALERGITVGYRGRLGMGDFVTDPKILESILTNLLSNAVKFSPSGSAVLLIAQSEPRSGVTFTVVDQGPGIAAEDIDRVTEPFVRLQDSYTSGIEGTGLGLYLAKSFAEALGGTLEIDSPHGEGTRIRITLPTIGTGKRRVRVQSAA